MDETEIIATIVAGQTNDYIFLVERYHIGLIIRCDQIVRDRAEAEDIAQQAFIKAFQQLSHFDPNKGRFSTWLYRIATNLAVDYLRRQHPTIPIDDLELPAPPGPDLYAAETAAETRAAVAALTNPHHRRVVEAYYWEGRSYQELATEFNVPLNTIKSWLHRAKEQLRETLS